MSISLGKIRKALMGVSYKKATSFSEGNSPTWKLLEKSVLSAVAGYHATLESSKFEVLVPRLNEIELEFRGYAYEGAAMGLTGLDCFLPWKKQLQAFLAGPGSTHMYMVHIGAGETLALLHRRPERFLARLDPVLRWLVMDGYGFNKGFFARRRYVEKQAVPKHLSPYARRIFDQGVGRSIWFSAGANIERVAATIAAFPEARQADLWVGIGVACAYVGGADHAGIEALLKAAGPYGPWLAMGAAFVAKGRKLAGNIVPHTSLACEILCGVSSEEAAHILDWAFENLPLDGAEPAYAILQQRLLARFADRTEGVYQRKEAVQ